MASAGAIAVAVGPLVGGLLTTYASWRWVFAGEIVIVLCILILARRMADSPAVPGVRLDRVDTLLSASGLGMVVFAIIRSGTWGFARPCPVGRARAAATAGAAANRRGTAGQARAERDAAPGAVAATGARHAAVEAPPGQPDADRELEDDQVEGPDVGGLAAPLAHDGERPPGIERVPRRGRPCCRTRGGHPK